MLHSNTQAHTFLGENILTEDVRSEIEIFAELAELCSSTGYVHAIAYICFRDNTIKYVDTITTDDVLQQFSNDRLVRTEISTLIGLACKVQLDTNLPPPDVIQGYIDKTDALLKEIHYSMMAKPSDIFDPSKIEDENFNPLTNGDVLREAIFYGGEAAYHFQYRDLSKEKYKKDNDWFIENKEFSIQQAIDVVTSIQNLQSDKINEVLEGLAEKDPDKWSFLPAYTFTLEEISKIVGLEQDIVKAAIDSFVAPDDIGSFEALDDFNPKNAYPVISVSENVYLLFQHYSLMEAFYETPFFWFNADNDYKSVAMQHRGEFTEEFSADRLRLVFGKERVFINVDIYDSSNNNVGEIDVLVIFANRAIILQAKSKKLTIASRKGNDNSLQADFKKAVQDANDQAFNCAIFLNDKNYKLIDSNGDELDIPREYKEIYPFCIVSDHYPSLSFQASQFLSYEETDCIKPPFVMDVFLLDVMTEMLQSPLQFLSYVNRRTFYSDKIFTTHELTILSYHLKQNLWVDEEYSMIHLSDDISADLDLAMLVRRGGVDGADTPDGILTKYKGSAFDQIIKDIDKLDNPNTIDLGFMLLSLSGDGIETINNGISQLVELGNSDGNHHDLSLEMDKGGAGLTIHCNDDNPSISGPRLGNHCKRRKYAQKVNAWFGICISAKTSRLRFGVTQKHEWIQSDEMDKVVKDLPKPQSIKNNKINFKTLTRKSKKVGRNDKCPCGSGKKYKKCCL